MWNENCTLEHKFRIETGSSLRFDPMYVVIYIRWIWTLSTIVIPFVALLVLNGKILLGLRRVKNRLQIHNKSSYRPCSARWFMFKLGGLFNVN